MTIAIGSVWSDNYFHDMRVDYRRYVKVLSVEDERVRIQQCAPNGAALPPRKFTRYRTGKPRLEFEKAYPVTVTKAKRFGAQGRSGFTLIAESPSQGRES